VRFISKPRLYKNLFQDEVFSSGIDSRRLDLDLGEMNKVKAYIALTKPRVIELLLITTVPTMILAQRGIPSLWLVLATLIGGALSAGSANAFNCYICLYTHLRAHETG
jgi:heme O synthase-like polyprenyltransferase